MSRARSSLCWVSLLLLALAPASGAQDAARGAGEEPPTGPTGGPRVVKPGDWVWIDFALWDDGGALVETTTHTQPMRLKHGDGKVPPSVEQAMLGMAVNEHKTVRLPVAAKDQDDPARFQNVPLEDIPESTREPGHPIVLDDGSGKMRAGRVHEIKGDRAVIDWNPLAGQTLTFDFRVVEIHVPADEE